MIDSCAHSRANRNSDRIGARRRLLRGIATLPLLALAGTLAATLGLPGNARAAEPNPIPRPVRELDEAAMALLDAAERDEWPAGRQALARAQAAAGAIAGVESDFVAAGGQQSDFFQARNNLTADLIEAQTALSVKEKRWLASCAVRIAGRAGELSQPFADESSALVPRVEALLFLALRMRQAKIWQDDMGFGIAHDDFKRLWQNLRGELADRSPARVRALDDALAGIGNDSSSADLKSLYNAVQGLHQLVP